MVSGVGSLGTRIALFGEVRLCLGAAALVDDGSFLHQQEVVQEVVNLGLRLMDSAHDRAFTSIEEEY